MNQCARCDLELPPGAAHLNEDSCIQALKAAMVELATCRGCEKGVKFGLCPGCAAKAFAQGVAARGLGRLKESLLEGFLNPSPPGDDDEAGGSRPRGKRFVP